MLASYDTTSTDKKHQNNPQLYNYEVQKYQIHLLKLTCFLVPKILHDVPFWVAHQLMTFVDQLYHGDVKKLLLTFRTTLSITENKSGPFFLFRITSLRTRDRVLAPPQIRLGDPRNSLFGPPVCVCVCVQQPACALGRAR